MPTVRVSLRCATPTHRPDGLYDTFINVTDEEYECGIHVRIAQRRAKMLGYERPFHVMNVRVLGLILTSQPQEVRLDAEEARRTRVRSRMTAASAAAERSPRAEPMTVPPLAGRTRNRERAPSR